MSGKRRDEVGEAAAVLLVVLSEGQMARARQRDSLTQVPGWALADLEVAVEKRAPGLLKRARAEAKARLAADRAARAAGVTA
ncbi:hypothetical protein [Cellulosimicrobium sp. TH-20]|uniref:hypothetical protein n=1 Tax=Cellulosimicrobium sp. TH-20 TaxID=1980001 RepID=UPI00119ED63D|nr:hypothetical protein [Cellulosimicrobium sp. TH-20]